MTADRDLRIDALTLDMTARLRPYCSGWPQDYFERMVRRLAEITVKYEGSVSGGVYDRRSTDRLVAEMRKVLEQSEHLRDEG